MKKANYLIIGLSLFVAIGCSKDNMAEAMATKAELTGYRSTLTRGDKITHTYDFSKNYEVQTQVYIKHADNNYKYELKLVGRTLKDVFTVELEEMTLPKGNSNSKSMQVSPTQPNLVDTGIYVLKGLGDLSLSADYYDIWLIEKNSGTELKATPFNLTLTDNIDYKIKDSDVSNFMQISNPISIITKRNSRDYFYPSPRPSKSSTFKFVVYSLEDEKVGELDANTTLQGNYVYRFSVAAIVDNLNLTLDTKYYFQFESTDAKYKSLPEFFEAKSASVMIGNDH